MFASSRYILCFGWLFEKDAAGLGFLCSRFGSIRPIRVEPICNLKPGSAPMPPPTVSFSLYLYKATNAEVAKKLCQFLNRKYSYLQVRDEGSLSFEPWDGYNPDDEPLIDEHLMSIEDLGVQATDPFREAGLLPGARLIAQCWLTAHRLEEQILKARSGVAASPEATAAKSESAGEPPKRRGRLKKEDSKAKQAHMLATIRQHPSLKDDLEQLATMVGVGVSTVRRWLAEEEKKYRDSRAASVGFDEE